MVQRLTIFITLSGLAFDFAWWALGSLISPTWADGHAAAKFIELGRRADLAIAKYHPDNERRACLLVELTLHLQHVAAYIEENRKCDS